MPVLIDLVFGFANAVVALTCKEPPPKPDPIPDRPPPVKHSPEELLRRVRESKIVPPKLDIVDPSRPPRMEPAWKLEESIQRERKLLQDIENLKAKNEELRSENKKLRSKNEELTGYCEEFQEKLDRIEEYVRMHS